MSDLIQALSRLAGNRHSDGTSSVVSHEDRTAIINGCYDLMSANRQPPVVLGAIAVERARQIAAGYDAAHDDAHLAGDIINSSWGASARIYAAQDRGMSGDIEGYQKYLIQAAAQIVAEVERVQRAALAATSTGGTNDAD